MRDYYILDERIKPDARGQLGGVKIEKRGGARVVKMTAAQAQYYLDHGAIGINPPKPK